LRTGERLNRENPLTGMLEEWKWSRAYGCNYPIASENLLTFRSGAAGFFDIKNDGGTGNLGGFKSGCTSNLVAADGVLNAPDYTRTCSCAYQNQTSLALIHMPEVELWTFNEIEDPTTSIKRLGLNLGAPGDRREPNGTMWLDYPDVGGQSPKIEVVTVPEVPKWFRSHSTSIEQAEKPWIAASGAEGLNELKIRLQPDGAAQAAYTVRLHFAEPDDIGPGQRTFDISLQGAVANKDMDIVKLAGGAMREYIAEFNGILISENLVIGLTSKNGDGAILSGVEAIKEN